MNEIIMFTEQSNSSCWH